MDDDLRDKLIKKSEELFVDVYKDLTKHYTEEELKAAEKSLRKKADTSVFMLGYLYGYKEKEDSEEAQ